MISIGEIRIRTVARPRRDLGVSAEWADLDKLQHSAGGFALIVANCRPLSKQVGGLR